MKKRNYILILLLTIIVLYIALKDDYRTIITLLLNTDIRFLCLGFFLVMGYCFMKTAILYTIVNEIKPYPFLSSLKLQLMTFFFNAVTPFATGGQPFQVYILKKNGIKVTYGTNVILQETILHQVSMLLLSVLVLGLNAIFKVISINSFLLYVIILGFILNTGILLLLFSLAFSKKLDDYLIHKGITLLHKLHLVKNKEKTVEKWQNSIQNFNECSHILLKNKKRLVKLITSNMLGLISIYLVPLALLYSFHNFTAYDGITALVLTTFTSLISSYVPLPGGTGGQEYIFILLFSYYIPNPLLNSVMILWRFITYYLPMMIGAILFNIQKKEM